MSTNRIVSLKTCPQEDRRMNRKPSFANLRTAGAVTMAPAATSLSSSGVATESQGTGQVAASRKGRKQIAGFFSPEMSFAMHTLARRQNRSLQALMAEAFNDVLRKHGESPIGD
jgi:hypothetical protein